MGSLSMSALIAIGHIVGALVVLFAFGFGVLMLAGWSCKRNRNRNRKTARKETSLVGDLMAAEQSVAGALGVIDELRTDAKFGKRKHFAAGDRKLLWHRLCGVPVILINLFVGIVLLNLQDQITSAALKSAPSTIVVASKGHETGALRAFLSSDTLALLSIILAFSAASLSAVQTFFNFYKSFEGHRAIGNRYAHLSRQCKALKQKHLDIPFNAEALWKRCEELIAEYNQINIDGEVYPTSAGDLKKACSGLTKPPDGEASI